MASAHATAGSDVPAAPIALSALALGCALQLNFGQYHPIALLWLTLAIAGVAFCVAKPTWRLFRLLNARPSVVFGAALLIQIVLLLTRSPGATGGLAEGSNLLPFRTGVILGAALV